VKKETPSINELKSINILFHLFSQTFVPLTKTQGLQRSDSQTRHLPPMARPGPTQVPSFLRLSRSLSNQITSISLFSSISFPSLPTHSLTHQLATHPLPLLPVRSTTHHPAVITQKGKPSTTAFRTPFPKASEATDSSDRRT
jgi:hypothetical protein